MGSLEPSFPLAFLSWLMVDKGSFRRDWRQLTTTSAPSSACMQAPWTLSMHVCGWACAIINKQAAGWLLVWPTLLFFHQRQSFMSKLSCPHPHLVNAPRHKSSHIDCHRLWKQLVKTRKIFTCNVSLHLKARPECIAVSSSCVLK